MDKNICDIFRHVYEVKVEGDRYLPRRFSERSIALLGQIRTMFHGVARCGAGISLNFYTDAEEISFDYKYEVLYTRIGGFNIYEQEQLKEEIILPQESCQGTLRYRKRIKGEALVEIFLPSNAEVTLWNLQLGNFRPTTSEKQKLVLYYGDSLTHCAYHTNASLSWIPRVARMTGTDYINRGVGSLFYEASYLDEQEMLEPDMVFVQFGGNDLVKRDKDNNPVFVDGIVQRCGLADISRLSNNAGEYLVMLKKMYPGAKISVLSLIHGLTPVRDEDLEVRRAFDKNLQEHAARLGMDFIDFHTILTPAQEYYVADNTHYTVEGNAAFAEGFRKYVESV